MDEVFLPCSCGSEVLRIAKFDLSEDINDNEKISYPEFTLSIFYDGYDNKMTIWQRIKYCLHVLKSGCPYEDQMVLTEDTAGDLADFITEALYGEEEE